MLGFSQKGRQLVANEASPYIKTNWVNSLEATKIEVTGHRHIGRGLAPALAKLLRSRSG
jgi:hypothetical protein